MLGWVSIKHGPGLDKIFRPSPSFLSKFWARPPIRRREDNERDTRSDIEWIDIEREEIERVRVESDCKSSRERERLRGIEFEERRKSR